jgi:hypothetical protein
VRNIRLWMVVGIVVLLALGALAVPGKGDPQTRTLEGVVMGRGDAPLAGAVVYLKNTRTLSVKSQYAGDDGSYRFNALSPNNDYEVFAEYKSKRSDTKTLSSFDSRPAARINLHIDVAK